MEKKLKDIVPIMGIEQDCILSKQGDITIVFSVGLSEIFTLSNEGYERLHQAFIKALRVLPKYTIFHKQDWFTKAVYRGDFQKEQSSFLSRSSELFFNERPYLQHHCYIMLTKKPDEQKPSTSLFSSLIRKTIVPAQTLSQQSVQDFLDSAGQFKQLLEDSGFLQLEQLKATDISSSKYTVGLLERYLSLGTNSSAKLISDMTFKEHIYIGNHQLQCFTLSDAEELPAYCGSRINYDKYCTDKTKFSIGFAAPLGLLLSCNHLYNQYIFVDDASKTIKKLESKRLRLQSLAAYSRENANSRDAANDFLNEAIGEQRLPIKAHFNVMVWADTMEEQKELKNKVSSAMAQLDAVCKQESVGAPQIFWAGLPGNEADFPMNDSFDCFAEQACCFLNLETNYRDSISAVGLRLGDRLTGKPVHVDLSDEPINKGIITNRNKFILGPSGSGKSFFTNHMLRTYYEQGAHIVLVDVGHSYKGLCDLVSGYYFTYEEKNPIQFNPFYLGSLQHPDTEKKESIKTLLLALWKKDDEPFTRSEYVALSNALQGFYDFLAKSEKAKAEIKKMEIKNAETIFPCFNSFYEYVKNDFSILLKKEGVQQKDFDLSNFLYVLRPYYKGGEFDYLLNATENLDLLEEPFIVFELDNIKDHPILFPVVTIIIMEVFIAKMRKLKGIRKIILIEEA